MDKQMVLDGTYGLNETPCDVFAVETSGGTWYVVEGGSVVNLTMESLDSMSEPINVELLSDSECFTWNRPIETLEDLQEAIDD